MTHRIVGFRSGNGISWTPDTDDCEIELSRGRFVVFFEDGSTDPAEVGFETMAEAEDFVAKSDRAYRNGEQRPHRIEATGAPAGAPLRFIKPSKVHTTIQEVQDECVKKNTICAEIEKLYPDKSYSWSIDKNDRTVVISFADSLSDKERQDLELVLDGKVRVV